MKKVLLIVAFVIGTGSAFAKDLPIKIKKGMPYLQARTTLIKNGWQPVTMHKLPNLTPTCWQNFDHDISWQWPEDKDEAESCKYEEIESCSGSGMGFCSMYFSDGSGKYLNLITDGGEPPEAQINNWKKKPKLPKL